MSGHNRGVRINGPSSVRWERWLVAHWLAIPTILISLGCWHGYSTGGAVKRPRALGNERAK